MATTAITKKHIEEKGYGFDVYYDETGNEICRCGTGMTKQAQLFFYLDLLQGIAENGEWDDFLKACEEVKRERNAE